MPPCSEDIENAQEDTHLLRAGSKHRSHGICGVSLCPDPDKLAEIFLRKIWKDSCNARKVSV